MKLTMKNSKKDKFKHFFVECSDWSVFTRCEDEYEAALKSLCKMLQARGSNLNLSYTIIVQQVKPVKKEEEFFYVPELLFDLGEEDLAESLDLICKSEAKNAGSQK